MSNRLVRDGILDSIPVNSLSPAAELFYRRLMSVVDDYGRFEADPAFLRVRCYPRQLERHSAEYVAHLLSEVEGAELIITYERDGKRYLEFVKFGQIIRAKKSKYPAPPGVLPSIDDPPFGTVGENTNEREQWFAEWWGIYWRKVGRKAAHDLFCRRVKTLSDFQRVMAATRAQAPGMLAREPMYRPHGATWLNQERYLDEVEKAEVTPSKYVELKEW